MAAKQMRLAYLGALLASASIASATDNVPNPFHQQNFREDEDLSRHEGWSVEEVAEALRIFRNDNSYEVASINYSTSPANYFLRNTWRRYNFATGDNEPRAIAEYQTSGLYYIAHRGLVEMSKGIGENTLDAVQHAAKSGVNLVELDIQASKDGKPMVTHDDTFKRTTSNVPNRVDFFNASVFDVWPFVQTVMRLPGLEYNFTKTIPTYCQNGNQIMSLDKMIGILNGADSVRKHVRPGSCEAQPQITYFLDPKNLKSGKAAFQFIANHERSGSYPTKFFVKTYDNLWLKELKKVSDDYRLSDVPSAALSEVLTEYRDRIQVSPVISIRGDLDNGQYEKAMTTALGTVQAWSRRGAIVASVEFPGAWDDNWTKFVKDFFKTLRRHPKTYLPNNPTVTIEHDSFDRDQVRDTVIVLPVLHYGYRFPDITRRNDYDNRVEFYNWDMTGQLNRDIVNQSRGRLGSALEFAFAHCQMGTNFAYDEYGYMALQAGCFVTTDFPINEYVINTSKLEGSGYLGSPERELDW